MTIYDFTAKTIDGNERSLGEYKGKALLIANVASQCGLTPHYAGLEELYKNFIEEASRRYADAIVNDRSEVSKLVDLYALIARMKILSSDTVIEAAEKAGRLILDTYLSPNRTFVDLPDLINEMDPLRDFSEACRRELQSAHGR